MDKRIEKAILYISKYHKIEMDLEVLAEEVGLSKFHFHRLFKKELGVSPLIYINRIKLEHAAHFLIMYPLSKQLEVAFESGFSSPSVFARSFKQFYRQSPIAYRKEKFSVSKVENNGFIAHEKLPITFLRHKKVMVCRSNLIRDNVIQLYQKLIDKTEVLTNSIGFYIDAPFHKSHDECRYYAGLESEKVSENEEFLEIEEGYYTYIEVYGKHDSIREQIVKFKENFIDSSPYYIASLVAFEKIKLPKRSTNFDYFSVPRTVYFRIKRR